MESKLSPYVSLTVSVANSVVTYFNWRNLIVFYVNTEQHNLNISVGTQDYSSYRRLGQLCFSRRKDKVTQIDLNWNKF
jgi:hypothetical protein